MSDAMPRNLPIAVALIVLLTNGAKGPTALSAEAAEFLAHVPARSLVALRLDRLDRLQTHAGPLAESFGAVVPDFSTLGEVDGLDLTGDVAAGLTLIGEEDELLPYLLVPVSDYGAFVSALGGDPDAEETTVTLAGEELLAASRGRWALLLNQTESLSELGQLADEARNRIAQAFGDEQATVVITEAGLQHLVKLAAARELTPEELNRLRRVQHSQRIRWQSLDYWRDWLKVNEPVVLGLQARTEGVLLATDIRDDHGLDLRIALLPSPDPDQQPDRETAAVPAIGLDGTRPIVMTAGKLDGRWQRELVEIYFDSFANGSDAVGIEQFAPQELADLRKSATTAQQLVQGVSALFVAPAKDEPVLANTAYLLRVTDAGGFLQAAESMVTDWNRAVESSAPEVDVVFDFEQLKIAGRDAIRYSVDLPTAFRVDNIPEVRDVLAKMFGHNGSLVVDLVTIDDRHVLICGLPETLHPSIVEACKAATEATPDIDDGWQVEFDPAAWQDWRNSYKRLNFGENVIGWQPKRLESTSRVTIRLAREPHALTATAEVPADVVEAAARLVRGGE